MDQQMSYFLPPITNTLPTGNCTLREVYRWITEDKSLETVTNELRTFIREGRVAEYRQLKTATTAVRNAPRRFFPS